MSETTFTVGSDKQSLIVERVFPASRHKVWEAYSNPQILARWWGPVGWETEIRHFDFTVGGYWHYCMRCVDKNQGDFYGMESWGRGSYTEISPMDLISQEDAFSNSSGEINPDMPVSRTTVRFQEEEGQTRLISQSHYESEAALQQVLEMGMEEGFRQTLDNLERLLLDDHG